MEAVILLVWCCKAIPLFPAQVVLTLTMTITMMRLGQNGSSFGQIINLLDIANQINYHFTKHIQSHNHPFEPPTAVSILRQFRSPHICVCLTEETLKAGGPFYLVSVPREVKDPTQGVNV